MEFGLSEDQIIIRQSAAEFAENVLRPLAAELDRESRFPRENLKAAAKLGFLGVLAPETYDGAGLGNLELTIILEEVNRCCASTGVTLSVHNSLVCWPLTLFGTDEQKGRYLPKLARGEWLGAYALSEPDSGTDAASLTLTAEARGDRFVLNGTKTLITSGAEADLVVVMARTGEGPRSKGITAFLVERGTPGFKPGTQEDKLGIRASDTSQLIFEDCEVPAENLLGRQGEGFKIAMKTLDGGRIGIASQAVGIAQACLEESVKYAKERRQFGKTLSEFQAIQWKIADIGTRVDASRLLVRRAAVLRDAGKPHTREAAMAKLFASRTANFAATEALQIHGGVGYTKDFIVERLFRDARITEIYEGTTEVQKIVISRKLLE
jgi:butyryl-CoA dehydrogenase